MPQAVPFASIAPNLKRCTEVCCSGNMMCGLAVGLVSRAMVAFQSVGWFGYDAYPTSARPWQNQVLYDWSARCPINIQDNWACGIMYAIIGYQVNLLMLHHPCLSYSMPCPPACSGLRAAWLQFVDLWCSSVYSLGYLTDVQQPACDFVPAWHKYMHRCIPLLLVLPRCMPRCLC